MATERMRSGNIEVTDYSDWMRPQVTSLFVREYGGSIDEQEGFFQRFFDHPFQRNRAIRLAALDGETVVGFQSLFYWPYRYGDTVYRSFQSGRSLVSPDYRGRGIFRQLLGYLDEHRDRYGFDFLMGFPVEASFGSFLKSGWSNPLDLFWRVRPLHPFSLLRPQSVEDLGGDFDQTPDPIQGVSREGLFELAETADFSDWRSGFSLGPRSFFFHHHEGSDEIRFDCKLNWRGRAQELVLGGVRRTTDDPAKLSTAVAAFLAALKSQARITMVSVALNERCERDPLIRILASRGFLRARARIHFITKDFGRFAYVNDPASWILFRSDVDTW